MNTKIFKATEVDFNKIGFLRPIYTKENIVLPIFYSNNRKISFVVQIPSLILNNSYQNKGYIILPLNGKNSNTTNIVNVFFKTLDKTIVDKIKLIISELKNSGKLLTTNISYRAIVNELEGDDNDVYKNGLVRYRLDLPDTQVYDEKRNLIDKSDYNKFFIKGVYVKSIIEITSLVINIKTGNITVYIKPLQIRIQDESIDMLNLKTYSFIDDDSENETDNMQPKDIEPKKNTANQDMSVVIGTMNTQTDCLETEQNNRQSKPIYKLVTKSESNNQVAKSETNSEKPINLQTEKPNQHRVINSSDNDDGLDNIVDVNSEDMDDNEIKNYFESINEKK